MLGEYNSFEAHYFDIRSRYDFMVPTLLIYNVETPC